MNRQNNLILVDSSVWVLALKRNCPVSIKQLLGDLLEKDLIATCGLIMVEILQGSKNKKEYNEITEEFQALHYLEIKKQAWKDISQLSFDLRRKGITVPTIDLCIAALAIYHDLTIFHADHHFETIAKNSSLKSKQISPGI